MKLYTEADLMDFIDINGCIVQSDLEENQLTPIEIPSDEELEEQGNLITDLSMRSIYILGAKWMRDKIKGGNNEQQ